MRLDNKWTDEELRFLRLYYPNTIRNVLIEHFPKRTYESIRSMAKHLGIKRDNGFRDTSICRRGHQKLLGSKCIVCYDEYQINLRNKDPKFFARAQRKYKQRHPETVKEKHIKHKQDYRKQWLSYLRLKYSDNPHCAICNIEVFWEHPKHRSRACLDHRRGNEIIKKSPRTWIQNKPCNETNIKIFESCDFGLLCNQCNLLLPSDQNYRLTMVNNLLKYLRQ